MKKLLNKALKQHDRDIHEFATNLVNQDMLRKVFKDLTRQERVDISAMMFDFDRHQAGRFALAIEDHNAIISYRYATEKDFVLPKIEFPNGDEYNPELINI